MAAIAIAESGGESDNSTMKSGVYRDKGETSYGLWQINMTGPYGPIRRKQFGISSNEELYDPLVNAKAAYFIHKQLGQGYGAWTAYGNSNYRNALKEARSVGGKQISSTQSSSGMKSNNVIPERKGETIIIDSGGGGQQSSPQVSSRSSSTESGSSSDIFTMLNKFIKQKMLFDLSYN